MNDKSNWKDKLTSYFILVTFITLVVVESPGLWYQDIFNMIFGLVVLVELACVLLWIIGKVE